MCEFCVKHGEGKKWYLNAKNYSDELMNHISRRKLVEQIFSWIDKTYRIKFPLLKILPFKIPLLGDLSRHGVRQYFLYRHWGQVIPIEDVEKILEFANTITRIPCICRICSSGKEHRVCFLTSIDPGKAGIADVIDQSFLGGPDVAKFERVDKRWALDFMKKSEANGMLHTIWTFKAPFISGICNCDYSSGCISMKMFKEVTPVMFRSEYVAEAAVDDCVGCQACMKLCQFGAIGFDKKNMKIKINDKKCYGCGICRGACNKNAIRLVERNQSIKTVNMW